jgi:8-oxo-dGTP pyrophosphatase MutT (NUDIX family)
MSREDNQHFNISQKAVLIRDNKCLIMEIGKYPGLWELPGGHVSKGETNTEAFKRELKEELDLDTYINHGVVDYEIWYHGPDKYPICGIVLLIENDDSQVKISNEHLQMKWVTPEELTNYNFLWPAAKRMAVKGFEKYNNLKNK